MRKISMEGTCLRMQYYRDLEKGSFVRQAGYQLEASTLRLAQ